MKKKLFAILFFCALFTTAKAQYVTVSDTSFRNFLMYNYPGCFNSAKQLDTTCSRLLNDTLVGLGSNLINGIKNIDEIKYFK